MIRKNKRQVSLGAKSFTSNSQRDEFNPDYSSIRRELKRIGILAGSFIAILIVLSFFQNSILALFIR